MTHIRNKYKLSKNYLLYCYWCVAVSLKIYLKYSAGALTKTHSVFYTLTVVIPFLINTNDLLFSHYYYRHVLGAIGIGATIEVVQFWQRASG